jgi:hypothetical protein
LRESALVLLLLGSVRVFFFFLSFSFLLSFPTPLHSTCYFPLSPFPFPLPFDLQVYWFTLNGR